MAARVALTAPALYGTHAAASAGVVNQRPACAAPSSTFERLLWFLQDRDEQPCGWPQSGCWHRRSRAPARPGWGNHPLPSPGLHQLCRALQMHASEKRDGGAAAIGSVTPRSQGDAAGRSGGAAGTRGSPLWSQSRSRAAPAGQGRARKPRMCPGSCSGGIAISPGASSKSMENSPAADAPPLKKPLSERKKLGQGWVGMKEQHELTETKKSLRAGCCHAFASGCTAHGEPGEAQPSLPSPPHARGPGSSSAPRGSGTGKGELQPNPGAAPTPRTPGPGKR